MKVWNYMSIMLAMLIFLYFLGFSMTSTNEILSDVGLSLNETEAGESTVDIGNSNWFNNLFDGTDAWIAAISLGGAIIIGLFGKTLDWKLILGVPFFTTFGLKFVRVGYFLFDLAKTEASWLAAIVVTVFGTLTVMYVFSVMEWFGGGDN